MRREPPIERTVDLISRAFVPLVVVLALSVFAALMLMHAGAGMALMRATSIMVIACPCVLGLATPLAITAAIGLASQQGILIADSRALEAIGKVDVVVLDKTGTVTLGDFRLLDFALTPHQGSAADEFNSKYLPLLAGIEIASEHLLGRAVVQFARERDVRPADVEDVVVRKGEGITALIAGENFFIGNLRLASAMGCTVDPEIGAVAGDWQRAGKTVAYFGCDRQLLGVIAFGDRIKPGATQMIQNLRRRGIAVKLVSGDAAQTTAAVAAQIGIADFIGEVSPEGKALLVQELQHAGKRVAVIGDGVNDAPALTNAEVGIALGTGAEIAMSAAPVVLVTGSLEKVEETFQLAARATRVIRQNLFWAFFYNTAGIALAISGLLNPIMAAGAMLLSSTSVVANSLRLNRLQQSRRPHLQSVALLKVLQLEDHGGPGCRELPLPERTKNPASTPFVAHDLETPQKLDEACPSANSAELAGNSGFQCVRSGASYQSSKNYPVGNSTARDV